MMLRARRTHASFPLPTTRLSSTTHTISACTNRHAGQIRLYDDKVSIKGSGDGMPRPLVRLAQHGALPSRLLKDLLAIRRRSETQKADRRLLRVVDYLIQLLCGDTNAGTPVAYTAQTGALNCHAVAYLCYSEVFHVQLPYNNRAVYSFLH